ncbi:MAG: NAD+ synthase [Bacteroidales bacterium]|jgi:NAD+ synthase (glutamine-hydrolysing)|nr:NAD+ synthase [Bacteroidales bacterium]
MKIQLEQLNYTIGDLRENSQKIISAIEQGKSKQVDLVVFSELALCGYIPHDMLEQKDFIDMVYEQIDIIASHCHEIAIILGSPWINDSEKGKKLFNAALFISDGQVQKVFKKTLLPTYDIFDDYRYFEPNTEFNLLEYKGEKIAVTICEDLWDKQEASYQFAKETLYSISPLQELSKHKPDYVINIAGSPFSYNQEDLRKQVLIQNAKQYNLPIIYVNQIGANTELIYDGGSRVINQDGEIVNQLSHFNEDSKVIDTEEIDSLPVIESKPVEKIEMIHNALVLGIRDFYHKMGFKTAIMGLSGGIDSALTAALVAEAIGGENTYGILMPSKYSSDHSIKDAVQLAKNLGMHYETISIQQSFESINTSMSEYFAGKEEDVTEENIQARLRGVILMAASNKDGHILVNTSNKSETAVGYTTLYGDMNGGFSVLGDVYKTDVFALSRFINRNRDIIPENSITKPPSAELRLGQKDEDSLPPYEILDGILFSYIEKKLSVTEIINAGYAAETVRFVVNLVNRNEHKRFQAPPILRVSSKAFGFGRRMPLIAKYLIK